MPQSASSTVEGRRWGERTLKQVSRAMVAVVGARRSQMAKYVGCECETARVDQGHVVVAGVDKPRRKQVHLLEVGQAAPSPQVIEVETTAKAWPQRERK